MFGLWVVLGLIGLAVVAPALVYLGWLAAAAGGDPPPAGGPGRT